MPIIPLGLGDFGSYTQNVSRFKTRNMYLADNPISQDGISRITRPTLSRFLEISSEPIRGIWAEEGSLNGSWLIAAGPTLYRFDGTTTEYLASLTGSDYITFAAIAGRVIYLNDGKVFRVSPSFVVTQIVIPDDEPISSITSLNSYFILSVKDTQKYYFIEPGQDDPDPLSFASAERLPDAIVAARTVGDEIWMLGEGTTEILMPSGNAEFPFSRISGRIYPEGCLNADTAVVTTSSSGYAVIWVTDSYSVVLGQNVPRVISTTAEEEKLREATNLRAWSFKHLRNSFYILTSDQFTLVYDLTKGLWYDWYSYDLEYFRAHMGFQTKDGVYAGDSETGIVWKLEEGEDDDGSPVVKEVSGFVTNTSTPQPCYAVFAFVNVGWSPNYTLNPTIEMRWSDDLGTTWSSYRQANLGRRGEYSSKVFFRSLGQIRSPGKVFEFRCSDPVRLRIDYAVMNEE